MKGFHRVLKFNVYESYNNARKIADEIIVSLINNTSIADHLPTYISTVRRSLLSILDDTVDYEVENTDSATKDEDEEIADYVIRIYKVSGNRKSRLSVTQNEQLREIVLE